MTHEADYDKNPEPLSANERASFGDFTLVRMREMRDELNKQLLLDKVDQDHWLDQHPIIEKGIADEEARLGITAEFKAMAEADYEHARLAIALRRTRLTVSDGLARAQKQSAEEVTSESARNYAATILMDLTEAEIALQDYEITNGVAPFPEEAGPADNPQG